MSTVDRPTILVVDDTPANLAILVDYLGQHAYSRISFCWT